MNELAAIGASTFLAAGAAIAGWILGRRRGASEGSLVATSQARLLSSQRDAAEQRAREARGECHRWRAMSLAPTDLSSEPLFVGRPTSRDAEALANLIRGLVLVDDVVIADLSGLPLTREAAGSGAALAALAGTTAAFVRRLALSAVPVVQISIETFTADHVCVRPLLGRADGAVLVVKTTSQPVSPLAMDAVVHAAARTAADLPPVEAILALRGATETQSVDSTDFAELFREMEEEVRGDLSGIVLTSDSRTIFSAVSDGPQASVRTMIGSAMADLQARVGLLLRGAPVARVEVVLRDGSRIGWAAMSPQSRLALLTFGRTDARLAARLTGRLRRVASDRKRLPSQESAA